VATLPRKMIFGFWRGVEILARQRAIPKIERPQKQKGKKCGWGFGDGELVSIPMEKSFL